MIAMMLDRITRPRMALLLGLLQISEMLAGANCNADGCLEPDGSSSSCLKVSPYSKSPRGVSKDDQEIIIALHNYLRRQQSDAADMQLMVWDEELASKAQQWSDKCSLYVDYDYEIRNKYSFGQNIGYFSNRPSWNVTLLHWFSDTATDISNDYTLSSFSKLGLSVQMIMSSAAKIGCGRTTCPSFIHMEVFVCNYAPEGNSYHPMSSPYTSGATCAACQKNCNQGLCDCGGLVCKNGGTINLETCSCTCTTPFYAEPDCYLKCDDALDEEFCQHWNEMDCDTHSMLPPVCPIKCGLCPDHAATTNTTASYNDSRGSVTSSQDGTPTPEQNYSAASPKLSSSLDKSVTVPSSITIQVSNQSYDLTERSFDQTFSTPESRTTSSAAATVVTTNCLAGYKPPHSACMEISSFSVTPRGISQDEKAFIVALHNNIRRLQNATDMQQMVWDDEAASIAQKWSDNCNYGHDTERDFADGTKVGQNVASGFRSWNETIEAWHGEIVNFQYGSTNKNFYKLEHYMQLVRNATSRVGCGFTTCANLNTTFFVCNYVPADNFNDRVATPYTQGTPCSACPAHCRLGLCDCGGLTCKNGGTLDLTTCSCACQSPYTRDPECTRVEASYKDTILFLHNSLRKGESASDMQLMSWDDDLATAAQNAAMNCKFEVENHDTRAIPGKYSYGQLLAVGSSSWNDAINGWYSAERTLIHDSASNISTLKGRPVQILRNSTVRVGCGESHCQNVGQTFYVCNYAPWSDQTGFPYTKGASCSACSEHCNSGLCDCNGLVCKNGGTLDVSSCQCTCKHPYTAVADCGVKCPTTEDPWYCGDYWPQVYCTAYDVVPFYCPRLCGVCPASTNGKPELPPSTKNPCAACPGNCVNGSCDCTSVLCRNGGVRDPFTCKCSCPIPFRGMPDCSLNCTALTDAWYCGIVWLSAYCEIYSNVKSFCPIMCGFCPDTTRRQR